MIHYYYFLVFRNNQNGAEKFQNESVKDCGSGYELNDPIREKQTKKQDVKLVQLEL